VSKLEALYTGGVVTGIISAVMAGIAFDVGLGITYGVIKTILENQTDGHPVFLKGRIFLYAYGTPSFIVESDYNLDLRYGTTSLGIFDQLEDCIKKLKEMKLV